jgi:hypothetical protein
MIRINLLPFHLRPVKRSPLPYLISILFLAAVVLAATGVWVGEQARLSVRKAQLAADQKNLDDLKAIVDEFNQLTDQKLRLAEKISIIQEIVSDRIIWSRQLWNVARLTPDNFWYSSISEVERPSKETRLVFNEKTKKEEPKTVTIKRRVLELGGYVIKGPDGSNDISPLTFNTEQDAEFSSLFQLNSTRLLDTEFDGFKVRSFTLEYMINTGSEES